jgi:hypothetical protein
MGWDAAHDIDAFALNQINGGGWLPLLHGDDGRAMLHGGHHCRDAARYVIERQMAEYVIAGLHMQSLGDVAAFQQNSVAMHGALGHSGSARCVYDNDWVFCLQCRRRRIKCRAIGIIRL